MSHSVASLAGMQGKIREADPAETVRCLTLFVLLVEGPAKCLFSQPKAALYIAAIALQKTEDKIKNTKISVCLLGHIFLFSWL
jgi:hypothetical protein